MNNPTGILLLVVCGLVLLGVLTGVAIALAVIRAHNEQHALTEREAAQNGRPYLDPLAIAPLHPPRSEPLDP